MEQGADILTLTSFSYSYPGTSKAALTDVSLTVKAGECVCLTGNSGCGKSTLLLAIKGLLRGGRKAGSIEVTLPLNGRGNSAVGLVFQNAESQLLCSTVAEEVAFGPENLCVPPEEMAGRVKHSLSAVGLEGCESRNVDRFSAGQKQRIAIASVLSMKAGLLLMDEPSSQLDRTSKQELSALLAQLKEQGYGIVLAEHDILPFQEVIDRYLIMEEGKIVDAAGSSAARQVSKPVRGDENWRRHQEQTSQQTRGQAEMALSVRDLWLTYPESEPVLTGVELEVAQGEKVHILGQNGAGKSSLLRCLCGLERPDAGSIEMAEVGSPQPGKLAGKVGVLFQNPVRQLFADSVRQEVAFTVQRLGYRKKEYERLVEEALFFCRVDHLSERAPLTLSFGEQHRVALASVLAPRPRLLLLDEPFAGLDMVQRREFLTLLGELPRRFGSTVLIASHDELPDAAWPDRSLNLQEGRIVHAAG